MERRAYLNQTLHVCSAEGKGPKSAFLRRREPAQYIGAEYKYVLSCVKCEQRIDAVLPGPIASGPFLE
jgi:hypothetical protein